MSKVTKFGKTIALPSTIQIKHDDAGLPGAEDSIPADADAAFRAGDLARKHGISVDRAQMLVDRFGADRRKLEGAAQSLRARMA